MIQTGSGQILQNVDPNTARLYKVDSIREAADLVIRPLRTNGFESLEVKKDLESLESISKEDAMEITELRSETQIIPGELSSTREVLLRVLKPSFEENLKWRFSDGTSRFGASITDQEFQNRIKDRQEGFFNGDILRVVLTSTQRNTADGGFKTENIIERVIEHLPAPRQDRLPGN